jgi:hypothetical protein
MEKIVKFPMSDFRDCENFDPTASPDFSKKPIIVLLDVQESAKGKLSLIEGSGRIVANYGEEYINAIVLIKS